MRRLALVAALGLNALSPAAVAQNTARPNYAKAYKLAVRCFVVVGLNGDKAASRPAFDAALRLGQLQGLSNVQMNVDFDWAIARETENVRRDASYKTRTLGQCRQLGLAS